MFDFDAGKLLIVGVVALVFIPPKDLPRVLREVGQFVGRMRRMASEFQSQFMDAMREADMADVRQEARKLADSARVDIGFDAIADLDRQMVAKRPVDSEIDLRAGASAEPARLTEDLPSADPPPAVAATQKDGSARSPVPPPEGGPGSPAAAHAGLTSQTAPSTRPKVDTLAPSEPS